MEIALTPRKGAEWMLQTNPTRDEGPPVVADLRTTPRFNFVGAGTFILDQPDTTPAWWGNGTDILGANGEALMIVGKQGLGKSTIAQQLALGRAGFPEYNTLIGHPITPGRRVLYLAMDRPRQAARSLRRMVGAAWRTELDERVLIWQGPPPGDLARNARLLTQMCQAAEADTVIVDSLKDAAIGLSDDEVGAAWNLARQHALRENIEVVELHHDRKLTTGQKRTTATIDDIYGSTWLTSGAGSVIFLSGQPGDPVIDMHHVKQPMDEIGPYKLIHDHTIGRTSRYESTDLVKITQSRGRITVVEAACALFDTQKPTAAEREKARRRLEKLTKDGHLRLLTPGDKTASVPAEWGTP